MSPVARNMGPRSDVIRFQKIHVMRLQTIVAIVTLQEGHHIMRYRERRYPCNFPVTLSSFGTHHQGCLSNISYHGAHAQLDARPCRDEILTLRINYFPINAQVIRIGPGTGVGLRFDRPLSKNQLQMIRQSAQAGRGRQNLRELS